MTPFEKQQEQDRRRRNSLLATLAFHGGNSVTRALRDDMELVHGLAVTMDRVRADLSFLADIGAALRDDERATITQAGRDHVDRLVELF